MHIVCNYIKHTYAVKHKITNNPQTATLSKNELASPLCSHAIAAPGLSPGAHTALNAMFVIPLYKQYSITYTHWLQQYNTSFTSSCALQEWCNTFKQSAGSWAFYSTHYFKDSPMLYVALVQFPCHTIKCPSREYTIMYLLISCRQGFESFPVFKSAVADKYTISQSRVPQSETAGSQDMQTSNLTR